MWILIAGERFRQDDSRALTQAITDDDFQSISRLLETLQVRPSRLEYLYIRRH